MISLGNLPQAERQWAKDERSVAGRIEEAVTREDPAALCVPRAGAAVKTREGKGGNVTAASDEKAHDHVRPPMPRVFWHIRVALSSRETVPGDHSCRRGSHIILILVLILNLPSPLHTIRTHLPAIGYRRCRCADSAIDNPIDIFGTSTSAGAPPLHSAAAAGLSDEDSLKRSMRLLRRNEHTIPHRPTAFSSTSLSPSAACSSADRFRPP